MRTFGWKREVPEPYKAHAGDVDPASVGRERIELEEDLQDQGELRMFDLFAEAVEDLYTGTVDKYVRNKPALWEEFAQRLSTGHMYLVDPDRNAPIPTVPTEKNICLDIHNNLKFSPRFCLWAVERKLTQTHETLARGTFAEFVYKELKEYVDSRSHLQDDFCKHLVINKQTRTFEDPNYVNTIGSKVVIRPLAETWELSVEEDQLSQRRMVQPTDPAEASNDVPGDSHQVRYQNHQIAVAFGDWPSGERAEGTDDATGDLPSGEMPEADDDAEGLEYLPSGKRSRTEAKEEEDVEMQQDEEQQQEEIPQDPMDVPDDAPDYGAEGLDDEYSETESVWWPRMASPAMARFFHNILGRDEWDGW